jgi:hypothetical protein
MEKHKEKDGREKHFTPNKPTLLTTSKNSFMTNKEFQELLSEYPSDLPIKLLVKHEPMAKCIDFDDENILLTSETAYVNEDAPEDEWDTEDGKIELGEGQRYLLLNPIIL